MLRARRCDEAAVRLDQALNQFARSSERLRTVALNVVDESIAADADLSETATRATIGRLVAQQRKRAHRR